MKRKAIFSIIVLVMFSGCIASGVKDLEIYTSSPPYSGHPEVRFGAPKEVLPLLQFRYVKESVHDGLPTGKELQIIKTKGASLGARLLVLDCPGPGVVGSGMCMVYGYD